MSQTTETTVENTSTASWETDYIDATKFTRNVKVNEEEGTVEGEGIFDIFMNTATKHLMAQYNSNRMRKEDYATAYIEIYNVTLQAALKAWLERGLAEAQLALAKAQIESEKAKEKLYARQIEGFDEDYKQKILKICLDSWAVGFSVAKDSFNGGALPSPMQTGTITSLYNSFILPDLQNDPPFSQNG